jgi:ribosomal protein L7/L12
MDETKLNIMLADAQLRARALALAIRGHFNTASAGDADVLEMLAVDCVTNLEQLLHASAMVTVVLLAHGERKIEAIIEVRAFTGVGLKEAKELVESAPIALNERFTVTEADEFKKALESIGATVMVV